MYVLENEHLRAVFSPEGKLVQLENQKTQTSYLGVGKKGLWRLLFMRGKEKECPVFPDAEAQISWLGKSKLKFSYESLTYKGSSLPIRLEFTVELAGDELIWQARLENQSQLTISEFWFPYLDGIRDWGGIKMAWPDCLGRIGDPFAAVRSSHSLYMGPDQLESSFLLAYPGHASMQWFELFSQEAGIYFGSHDASWQTTLLGLYGTAQDSKQLAATFIKYPFIGEGQSWQSAPFVIKCHKGDWHIGAKRYRSWALKEWYRPLARPAWVQQLHGWQRIILKHQYGEINWRYEDLPELYKQAPDLDLLVFGWWEGCFDNGYPEYKPDPALGGEEKLRWAIEKVHQLGGKVILYTNGHLMDLQGKFYQEQGKKIAARDIDGNEYREQYRFFGQGSALKYFGYKSFAAACPSCIEWQEQLLRQGQLLLDLGSDAAFFDQLGGHIPYLCFDSSHPHKGPAAAFGPGKVANWQALRNGLEPRTGELVLGTEFATDAFVTNVDFVHSCGRGVAPGEEVSPELFRYTFPEIPLSNRELKDDSMHRQVLNHAFLYGMRFDVEVWRCRGSIGDAPQMAEYLQQLVALRKKFPELLSGTFVHHDGLELAGNVEAAVYQGENRRYIVVANNTEEAQTYKLETSGTREGRFSPQGEMRADEPLPPHSVCVEVISKG